MTKRGGRARVSQASVEKRLTSMFFFWTTAVFAHSGARFGGVFDRLGSMRVLGIDCGTEITGWGVVESDLTARTPMLVCRGYGVVKLAKQKTLAERLRQVFDELGAQMRHHQPDVVAVEEVFYSVNAKSALKLGQVRGVALLAAGVADLPIAEYAPLSIKSAVLGYGLAAKEQVQFMLARLLDLDKPPEPADAADALAIAICHLHTAETREQQRPAAKMPSR